MCRFLFTITLFACLPSPLLAEDDAPPSAALVQQKLRELVDTKRRTAAVQTEWNEERHLLQNLNAIRQREIEELRALTEAAGERLETAATQRERLFDEKVRHQESRAILLQRIDGLEASLRALLPLLPPVLIDRMPDAAGRLSDPPRETRSLQDRYRDVLAVLTEIDAFQTVLTVTTERRETSLGPREVRVLYLGLAQAFFLDASGALAGVGHPGPEGWIWTETPELAPRLKRAFAIHDKKQEPGLVTLPLQRSIQP